jgi:ethanolamine ammonia-lyase large subunit
MRLAATIRNVVHTFGSLREVLAKANPPKSGDDLAGLSARSAVERVAARAVLAQVTLHELRQNPGRALRAGRGDAGGRTRRSNEAAFRAVAHLTVGQFREWLLESTTTSGAHPARRWRRA